jgi:hypothetical protein
MRRFLFVTIFCAALCLAGGPLLSHSDEGASPSASPSPAATIWKDPASGLTWQISPTGGMR